CRMNDGTYKRSETQETSASLRMPRYSGCGTAGLGDMWRDCVISVTVGTGSQSFLAGGRTNILLLGNDNDGKGNDPTTGGVPLAQTVMIVTVDPQTDSVGMLSIPRDMQVSENDYPEPKLDEVFSHGYKGNTTQEEIANGAAEVENVIQYNYGIHI